MKNSQHIALVSDRLSSFQETYLQDIRQKWDCLNQIVISDGSANSTYIVRNDREHMGTVNYEVPFYGTSLRISLLFGQLPPDSIQLAELKNGIVCILLHETQQRTVRRFEGIVGIMEHDLRNILCAIETATYLIGLKTGKIQEEIKEILDMPGSLSEVVQKLTRVLTKTIMPSERVLQLLRKGSSNMIHFAEGISGTMMNSLGIFGLTEPEKSMHDIAELLQEVILFYGGTGDIEITLDVPDGFSQHIHLDHTTFHRIMGNLLQNAKRYKKSDQEVARAHISVTRSSSGLTLSVQDHGVGMNMEDIRVYMNSHKRDIPTHYTATPHRDSHRVGAGSVMRGAESHGWGVAIQSKPGEFTDVSIHIPCDPQRPGVLN